MSKVAFSPFNSNLLASISGKEIIIWNYKTGKQMTSLKNNYNENFISIDFSPHKENILASISEDKIIIWDIVSEKPIYISDGAPVEGYLFIKFSPFKNELIIVEEYNGNIVWFLNYENNDYREIGTSFDGIYSMDCSIFHKDIIVTSDTSNSNIRDGTKSCMDDIDGIFTLLHNCRDSELQLAFSIHEENILVGICPNGIGIWDIDINKIKSINKEISPYQPSSRPNRGYSSLHLKNKCSLDFIKFSPFYKNIIISGGTYFSTKERTKGIIYIIDIYNRRSYKGNKKYLKFPHPVTSAVFSPFQKDIIAIHMISSENEESIEIRNIKDITYTPRYLEMNKKMRGFLLCIQRLKLYHFEQNIKMSLWRFLIEQY